MALDTNVSTWLDELKKAGAVSDEEWKVLSAVAEKPGAGEFIKGSVLRQSDYSRQLNEVSNLKKELEGKEAAVTKFQTDVATWKAGAEGNYRKAVQDAEAARNKLVAIATTYGIPEEEYKLDNVQPLPKPDQTVDKNYLTREDVESLLKKFSTEAALTDASVHDLNIRHLELFGKPLPNAVGFMQEALKAGKTLTGLFSEKFNVAQRERELLEEGIRKSLADEFAAKETKLRSELQIPAARPNDRGSLLFSEKFVPKLPESNGDAVGAAMAAYQSGKYSAKQ